MNTTTNTSLVLSHENTVHAKATIWPPLRKTFCLLFPKLNFDWFSKEKNLKVAWRFIKDSQTIGLKKNKLSSDWLEERIASGTFPQVGEKESNQTPNNFLKVA